jgi:hypothetical protein
MNLAAIFYQHYSLQIRMIRAVSSSLGETPIMTEGCFFTTFFTSSHRTNPFTVSDQKIRAFPLARQNFITDRIQIQENLLN